MSSQQSEESKEVRVVFVTHANHEAALRMAEQLVERKLVACVNILPQIESVYLWKDEVCRSEEVLMIIKTSQSKITELESAVKELHPYEVPEFVVIDSSYTSESYKNWVFSSVS